MKWLLLCFLSAPVLAQTPPTEYPIKAHNKGLITFYSANRIGDNTASVLRNAYNDADEGVTKRNGYQYYGTVPGCTGIVTGGWSYTSPNGTNYHFVSCIIGNNGQLFKTTGDGIYSVIGATFTTINPLRATSALGYEWFTNGVDQVFYTDGVSVSSLAATINGWTTPLGKFIGMFQSRIVLANNPNYQSQVYLSGYLNGSDYSLPAVAADTNAVAFPLNGWNDTRAISCMFDGFKNVLILWNNGQMWGLYGSGQSSFNLVLLNNEVGCLEQGTVQEFYGKLRWLSKRGIEEYDGTTVNMISWPIQDQVQTIASTLQKQLSIVENGTALSGTGSNLCASGPGACMSSTINPGTVVPSTWGVVEQSQTDWMIGTLPTSLNVTSSSGTIQFSSATFFIFNGDFHAGANGWTCSSITNGSCSTSANQTTVQYFAGGANSDVGEKLLDNGAVVYSHSELSISGQRTIDLAGLNLSTRTLSIQFYAKSANAEEDFTSTTFTAISSISFYGIDASYSYYTSGAIQLLISVAVIKVSSITVNSYFDQSQSSATPSLWISPLFDTAFSTSITGPFNVSISSGNGTGIIFGGRNCTASSPSGCSNWAPITPGSLPSWTNRYFQWESTFTTSVGTMTPSQSQISMSAATTGYFISPCFSIGSNITGWGAFSATYLPNGGNISFAVSTGTTCGAVQSMSANWQSQSNNTQITVATSSYLGVRALFNLSVATQNPSLSGITVSYLSGQGRPAAVSAVYNKRYYLGYSTNTVPGSYNDHVLVYDHNGTWSQLDDIFASSLWTYQLKFYSGSSLGDGNTFLQDTGQTDSGTFFTFDMQTPDIEFSSPFYLHDLTDLYVEGRGAIDPTKAGSLAVQYYIDGGTMPYTLGSVSTLQNERGYFYNRYSFPLTGAPISPHSIRLEYINTDQSPLTIYQSMLRYQPEPLP